MARREKAYSIALPKRPFLRGVARLFDFSGSMDHDLIEKIRAQYQNPPPIPSSEDAIRATWQAVGDSMRWAIDEYEKELDEK